MTPLSPDQPGTVVLVVAREPGGHAALVEALSDQHEISALEKSLSTGAQDPLTVVREMRALRKQEDEDFANYVEDLLSSPTVRPEVREHGVQWFRSKSKIEAFERSETEARDVIAQFAYQIYLQDRNQTDFTLSGPTAKVRVRVLEVSEAAQNGANSKAA